MAPLPDSNVLRNYITSLLKRTPLPIPAEFHDLSARTLLPRDGTANPAAAGVTPLTSIPNKAVFVLFGLIGVGFVCTGIWFFFWAKNGGFYFHENDWDDYKSTVLRRKGPNGTTLSGATESTDLGGGSVVHGEKHKRSVWGHRKKGKKGGSRYKDFDEETASEVTGSVESSELSSLKRKVKKDRKKAKKESRLRGGDLASEMTEQTEMMPEVDMDASVEDAIRSYRHEKPARVGGLNKESDASAWDGSTNDGSTAASELLSHRENTPTNTPTKSKKEHKELTGGAIRKVVSTSQPKNRDEFWARSFISAPSTTSSDDSRIKAEAAKLQAKGRAAQRRDFSFQAGDDNSTVTGSEDSRVARREERAARRASRSPTKKLPGHYVDSEVGSNVSSDLGTKSYHHPIPGLSVSGSEYADERRKKRAGGASGYRREGRDSLSEDGN